jgi:hypothetical protein
MTTTSEIVSVEPEFLSDRSRSSPLFAVGEFSFFVFLNTVQVQAEEATEGRRKVYFLNISGFVFFFFTFLILLNIFCYGFIEGDAIREIFYERKTRVHLQVIWMKSNLRKC